MDANTPQNKYAPTVWGAVELYDFTCPSGQLVQLKKVSLSDLMQAGMLDEMDTLGSLMQSDAIDPAQGKRPSDRQPKKPTKKEAAAAKEAEENAAVQELMKNPKQFGAMTRLMERMVCVMVVQPAIVSPWMKDEKDEWAKIPAADRTEGVIYSDSVDFQDQMALFGEAMGDKKMGDIAAFRDEANAGVDPVEDGGVV